MLMFYMMTAVAVAVFVAALVAMLAVATSHTHSAHLTAFMCDRVLGYMLEYQIQLHLLWLVRSAA
jgi:hypothetical protein